MDAQGFAERGPAPTGGSGASLPDSRLSVFANASTTVTTESAIAHLAEDVSAGTDITLDADGITIHLAEGMTFIATGSVYVQGGDLQSATDLLCTFNTSGAEGNDGQGYDSMSAAGVAAGRYPQITNWIVAGADCTLTLKGRVVGAGGGVTLRGGIDVLRVR